MIVFVIICFCLQCSQSDSLIFVVLDLNQISGDHRLVSKVNRLDLRICLNSNLAIENN